MRETPANDFWTNATGDGLFNTAGNWQDGTVPGANDTIVLDGGQGGTNADITFPVVANKVYTGIQIKNTYTRTAYFPANVSFGSYFQAGGSTHQSNQTVTVTSAFIWTAGDLNPYGSGTVILKGVHAGIIVTDLTSLVCGSHIVLDNLNQVGTNLWQYGTLTLNANSADIEVRNNSYLTQAQLNPAAPAPVLTTSGPGALGDRGVLLNGGAFKSYGGTVPSVQITSGLLDLLDGGLTVTGKVWLSPWGVTMSGAGSTIIMKNGETLKATQGVSMTGGFFFSDYNPNALQLPKIDGVFHMAGGEMELGKNSAPGVVAYTTLIVTQTAKLYGGTFHTKLDPTDKENRDAIDTEDKLDTTAGFTINPNNAGPVLPTKVLVSVNGFTANSVDPTNPNNGLWVMTRVGNNFEVKNEVIPPARGRRQAAGSP